MYKGGHGDGSDGRENNAWQKGRKKRKRKRKTPHRSPPMSTIHQQTLLNGKIILNLD